MVLIWLLTVTFDCCVIWILFLFIIICYPVRASIPLLCVNCSVNRCAFLYLPMMIMCHTWSGVLGCHLEYLQCFCLIDLGDIVLAAMGDVVCIFCFLWLFNLSLGCVSYMIYCCGYDLFSPSLCHEPMIHHLCTELLP